MVNMNVYYRFFALIHETIKKMDYSRVLSSSFIVYLSLTQLLALCIAHAPKKVVVRRRGGYISVDYNTQIIINFQFDEST